MLKLIHLLGGVRVGWRACNSLEMELGFIARLFDDKQIMNPLNAQEVFTCKDLVDDYRICRKEKRLKTAKASVRLNCYDYRKTGKCPLPSNPVLWLAV